MEGPFLLLLMMSPTETPNGPKGRVTLRNRDDTVVCVENMGAPSIAVETRKDELINFATEYI